MSVSEALQLDFWGGSVPLAVAPRTEPLEGPRPAPRTPGWYLLATNSRGPARWHVLVTGSRGTVVAACGVVGRTVLEGERMIMRCAECLQYAAVPPGPVALDSVYGSGLFGDEAYGDPGE